jgi:hypothetical protein
MKECDMQDTYIVLCNDNLNSNFIYLKFLSDGVRLKPEDEKFIQEKILEHHPEKQSKVSSEIDHIMV